MTGIIYAIRNTLNDKRYVGSTVTQHRRWSCHRYRLRRNKHHCAHLQSAWNKYGEKAFVFEILETLTNVTTAPALLKREQHWFEYYRPNCYNTAFVAGSPLGVKRSEATREKLRQSHIGVPLREEHKQHIREALLGRTFTPEWAAKIQAAKLGKKRSPEARLNMSKARRGLKRTPEAIAKGAASNRGQKRSPETRARMRAAQQRLDIRIKRSNALQNDWQTILNIYQDYAQDNVSIRTLAKRYDLDSSYVRAILHRKKRPPELCPDPHIRQQLLTHEFKFRHHRSPTKLSWNTVCEIRRLYSTGHASHGQLATQYDVSRETVGDIVNGKRRITRGT